MQSASDLARVRALLPLGEQPLLMAKVEKRRALANLDEIVEAADGVMVARGDLGVETEGTGLSLSRASPKPASGYSCRTRTAGDQAVLLFASGFPSGDGGETDTLQLVRMVRKFPSSVRQTAKRGNRAWKSFFQRGNLLSFRQFPNKDLLEGLRSETESRFFTLHVMLRLNG